MACCVLVGYLVGRAVNRFRRARPAGPVTQGKYRAATNQGQ
jgi:hypothetical protein